jgi:hypothetical protein
VTFGKKIIVIFSQWQADPIHQHHFLPPNGYMAKKALAYDGGPVLTHDSGPTLTHVAAKSHEVARAKVKLEGMTSP